MIVKRLIPGQDLKGSLEDIQDRNNLKSGIIICMVGSLDKAVLRMADGNKNVLVGPLEIVSATGTLAINGFTFTWRLLMIVGMSLEDISWKVVW